MTDDELGRYLRDEVPGPRPGYWDEIDDRLAGAAEERGATPSPLPGPGSDEGDTNGSVIRLRDMNHRSPRTQRSLLIGAAAAAAVVILAGFAVALTRTGGTDDDSIITDAAESSTTTSSSTTTEPTVDEPVPSTSGTAGAADTTVPAEPIDDDRRCYQGTDLGLDVTAYVDFGDEVDGGTEATIVERSILRTGEFYSIGEGVVAPDGTFTGEFRNMTEGTRFPAVFVAVGERGLSLADDVYVLRADCGPLADDLADIEATAYSIDSFEETNAPEIEYLPDVEPQFWTVVADGPVDARLQPGLAGELAGQYQPGDTNLVGSGRSARVTGTIWIEIAGGEERAPTWIVADVLEPVDDPGRECFASENRATVVVLEFSDDVETFTGALVVRTAGEETNFVDPDTGLVETTYFSAAGRRTDAGTIFDVNVLDLDRDETVTEEWRAFPDGLSAADRGFYEPTACAGITAEIAQIQGSVDAYPALP